MLERGDLLRLAALHGLAVSIHLFLSLFIAFGDAFETLRDREAVGLLVPGWDVAPGNTSSGDPTLSPCVKQSGVSLNLWFVTEVFNSVTTFAHLVYLLLCLWALHRGERADPRVYPAPALKQGIFLGRWLEYSITAPAMIVLISVQIGARDLFVYVHGVVLTALVMLVGGFVPQYFYPCRPPSANQNTRPSEGRPILSKTQGNNGGRVDGTIRPSRHFTIQRSRNLNCWVISSEGVPRKRKGCASFFVGTDADLWHLFSWFLLLQSWLPIFGIMRSGLQSARSDPSNEAPVAVIIAVVVCEFFFFSAFGVVETIKVKRERSKAAGGREKLYRRVEMAYIVLSVTSKSLLIALTSLSLSQMPDFQPGTECS